MKNLTINVGDYVRTKDGIILKVKDIEDIYTTDNIYIGMAIYDNEGHFVNDVEIIKSSPNIKDLIEEFDYIKMNDWGSIKFWRVVKAPYGKLMFEDDGWNELEDFEDEEIAEIITHEQMESIAYKVGE